MRIVAYILVALFLIPAIASALPGDGTRLGPQTDQCDNRLYVEGTRSSCLRFDIGPTAASSRIGEYNYLWLDPMNCEAAVPTCFSLTIPNNKNAITGAMALVGLLYAETNGISGLQRQKLGVTPPDALILV